MFRETQFERTLVAPIGPGRPEGRIEYPSPGHLARNMVLSVQATRLNCYPRIAEHPAFVRSFVAPDSGNFRQLRLGARFKDPMLGLLLLVLVLVGVGFAVHVVWLVAVIFALIWIVAVAFGPDEGAERRNFFNR